MCRLAPDALLAYELSARVTGTGLALWFLPEENLRAGAARRIRWRGEPVNRGQEANNWVRLTISNLQYPSLRAETLRPTSVPRPELSRKLTSVRSRTMWPPRGMSG